MTQVDRPVLVQVGFTGTRAVTAPLTVGQLNIAKWLENAPQAPAAVLDQIFPVPVGTTVDDVVTCLSVLLSRHEGLRSRYTLGNPGEQRVLASGRLAVPVLTGLEAHHLVAAARDQPFDVAAGSPARFVIGVRDGTVTSVAAAYSHIAVDFQAMLLLAREFATLVADPAARTVGVPGPQPVDRAVLEQQPARRRRLEQAMRHWGRSLGTAPAHIYARPRVAAATGSGATGISSPAAALALDRIAARTQVSRPTIVLAAFCALLSRRTGYGTCRFVMLSANRFESDLASYVGTLAQATYVSVEVDGAGFDDLVKRAFGAVMQSGLHGAYDVYQQHARSTELKAARGIMPAFEPMFNSVVLDTRPADRVPSMAELTVAAPRTGTQWVDLPPTDILLRFDLGQVDDTMIARMWSGDTGRVDRAETRALLLSLERLLVAAAAADLDHAGIVAALGLPPLPRPPGWLLVDACWVEVAEVQRLLTDAVGPAVSRVFAEVDGEPLVAYLAAGPTEQTPAAASGEPAGRSWTPQEVHAACLALLAGRHAAMAPRRYVLCGRSPADVTSLAAWQAQPVLATGTGRDT